MFEGLSGAIEVGAVIATVISAAVWVRFQVTKTNKQITEQNLQELEALVQTRGERIEDLEKHVRGLESRITKLEGAIEILKGDLGDVIAEKVAARINQDLAIILES